MQINTPNEWCELGQNRRNIWAPLPPPPKSRRARKRRRKKKMMMKSNKLSHKPWQPNSRERTIICNLPSQGYLLTFFSFHYMRPRAPQIGVRRNLVLYCIDLGLGKFKREREKVKEWKKFLSVYNLKLLSTKFQINRTSRYAEVETGWLA